MPSRRLVRQKVLSSTRILTDFVICNLSKCIQCHGRYPRRGARGCRKPPVRQFDNLRQRTERSPLISCPFGRMDTVGEFPKQRTYAFYPTEFKELTRLRLNSPTVSILPKGHRAFERNIGDSSVKAVTAGEARFPADARK
jgi:hypothetical protein